jgi:hypothetical protein
VPIAKAPGTELLPSSLRRNPPGIFHEVKVGSELDGDVSSFGKRFWALIGKVEPALEARLAGRSGLAKVTYADRYVRSPLLVRLVAEVVRELSRAPGGIAKDTVLEVTTSAAAADRPSFRVFHDWREARDQEAVLDGLLFDLGTRAIRVDDRRDKVHMRELRLEWSDGRGFAVRLDQGFGFLRAEGSPRDLSFNFDAAARSQVQALRSARFAVRKADALPVPLYVTESAAGWASRSDLP